MPVLSPRPVVHVLSPLHPLQLAPQQGYAGTVASMTHPKQSSLYRRHCDSCWPPLAYGLGVVRATAAGSVGTKSNMPSPPLYPPPPPPVPGPPPPKPPLPGPPPPGVSA